MIFFDTETCGLQGPIVLFQYAIDREPIRLVSIWKQPIKEIINLYELIANHQEGIVGFNLAFDWFHICQQYTTLLLLEDKNKILEDCLEEYKIKENQARFGPCIKPVQACDLMLHARKTEYQSTMDRKDIRIKRVPATLAYPLVNELDKRIPLKDIFFARKKDKFGKKWNVYPIKGNVEFCDVVLKFAPSSALKALAVDALKVTPDQALFFSDIDEGLLFPEEVGYAPFYPHSNWPSFIKLHTNYWISNPTARKYAEKDVEYTRSLYKYFNSPVLGDNDSELACMVGAIRWRGYSLDVPRIKNLRDNLIKRFKLDPNSVITYDPDHIPTAPEQVKKYLFRHFTETEKIVYETVHGNSTKKVALEDLETWLNDEGETHPVATLAKNVLSKRQAKYDIDIYNKLIQAGRFHTDFKVIGALSGRMAGGGSDKKSKNINPQGIRHTTEVRECFTLADSNEILCGGDFESFEVTIADAVYQDPKLREDLLSGKKIHGLFAMELFPGKSYEEIVKSKGSSYDMYDYGKRGVFALIYGGNPETLKTKLKIPIEIAEKACEGFYKKYPQVYLKREQAKNRFCSMRQLGGIGSRVVWNEPDDYAESLLGFKRYFTLENKICKALFTLANDPPKAWKSIKINTIRRDRVQTIGGALQSALYAAAFQIQAGAMRAGINHEIQSTGAGITKTVQRKIWDLQPSGVHEWLVEPFQVHDELLCPTKPDMINKIKDTVKDNIEQFRPIVPLLDIDWKTRLKNWSQK